MSPLVFSLVPLPRVVGRCEVEEGAGGRLDSLVEVELGAVVGRTVATRCRESHDSRY